MSRLIRVLELISLALWWGGLTFYAGAVVPLGASVTDERTQGFVTQQVTVVLNGLAFVALLLTVPAAVLRGKWWGRTAWGVAVLSLIGLFVVHQRLDQMLDGRSQSVLDETHFYGVHQMYLWLTSLQWVAGLVLLVGFAGRWLPSTCEGAGQEKPPAQQEL